MNPDIAIGLLIFFVSLSSVLAVFLWEARRDLNTAHKTLDSALDAADRADLRCSIYEEAMRRPVQAILPAESARLMAAMLIEYVAQELNGPMDIPIVPRDKGPQGQKS